MLAVEVGGCAPPAYVGKQSPVDRYTEIVRQYRDDFPLYSERCLKIKGKDGKLVSLKLNVAQQQAHALIEKQLADTGRVRALILKGRQQGLSTYCTALIYHHVQLYSGLKAYLLTHQQAATDNLYGMIRRYYDQSPALIRPSLGSCNAKELAFDRLDSRVSVGTAGSRAVGRSATINLFLGSEAAFWPNGAEHMAGIMQAVPSTDGSVIILESTGNGFDDAFYPAWQRAVAGEGEFQAIFLPWFWEPGYRSEPPEDWACDPDDDEYQAVHGLDDAQMYWREKKISELSAGAGRAYGLTLFRQEYPATPTEAFQRPGHDALLPPEWVQAAFERKNAGNTILMIGCDPADSPSGTGDRSVIAHRSGSHCPSIRTYRGKDPVELASIIAQDIEANKDKYTDIGVRVDMGGGGSGVVAHLKHLGYGAHVIGVYAGASALDSKYPNRRTEQAALLLEYLKDGGDLPKPNGVNAASVDSILSDFCMLGVKPDGRHVFRLESKTGPISPDHFDAMCLTFDSPIIKRPTAWKALRPAPWRP